MTIDWKTQHAGSVLDPRKALPALRQAVWRAPRNEKIHITLAQALFDSGQLDEIPLLLQPFENGDDTPPAIAYQIGRAALEQQDGARAIGSLSIAARGGVNEAHGDLARAFYLTGRADDALAAALAGVAVSPDDARSIRYAARVLIERGDAARARQICLECWQRGGRTPEILAARATAAAALGMKDELEELSAREPWFSERHPALGSDFAGKLAAEVLRNDLLHPSYAYKPTRGDTRRIDNFESERGDVVQEFFAMMRREVEAYHAERTALTHHPFMVGWPKAMSLYSWSLVMAGDGHEDWRTHTAAWLSGVYYAKIPAIARDKDSRAGCIGFGGLPAHKPGAPPFPEWTIEPQEGLLLLFPAYYPHRTWATGSEEPHISIAFNVVRAG